LLWIPEYSVLLFLLYWPLLEIDDPSGLISSRIYLTPNRVLGHWKLAGPRSLADRKLLNVGVGNVTEAGIRDTGVTISPCLPCCCRSTGVGSP
jgi:hypothetical protein